MPSSRRVARSLLVGLLHAAVLVAVALDLGYAVGPAEYTAVGLLWRYGGLVVVAALPVWLALRFRLVVPLLALVVTTGYVLGMELTPPGPTFRDVAELERLDEPTGIMVVENGLYIVRYMVNASVWLVGFLFAGLVEAVSRTDWRRLPAALALPDWLSPPVSRRQAAGVAAVGGLLHLVVMVWFARRLGVTMTGGYEWVLYTVSTLGMWLLAAVPLYLLVRYRLVVPATLLTGFIFLDVRSEFAASVDGAHALYFGAWFLFLAIVLVGGVVEYGLRRLDLVGRITERR
ncbi:MULTISPECIES: hypothetical protein [Halolamina]|uniref:Uncharacterized protein n=1 Tax=Halolamina pelagica TaxID=699431 RepID=A0A1I5U183_9EURY|nr:MULTISPECIES: hypothetical protein [Halolamina]NHX36746.1 hypothetical protein [Halolamina sp. R1-12]SFP89019.1 hypothetical protein SAMN05216277_11163 [Halolamina pelagica]